VTPRPAARGAARPRGFTLLEVMVAMAILAMAMMALSDLVSQSLRNHTRAVRLEVATLLARGKLAALQDEFDRTGFKDFDQDDEGTFEKEGHADVRWTLLVRKPRVELGPESILALLTGAKGDDAGGMAQMLQELMGDKAAAAAASDGGPTSVVSGLTGGAAMTGALQAQLTQVGEQIKKGLREVRLTVSWKDGAQEESFTVVTHLLSFGTGAPP
jgi:general secretion pathway protein I